VAVDQVMAQEARNAFCVVRPPGHHATPKRGMGFCVFNNIAIAARYAQKRYDVGRVLIVDWDVHHGNGTQDAFYNDDSVFFFSTHQHPWYPGTGRRDETGAGRGLGTNLNRPFAYGAGRREILGAFESELVEAARRFKPELLLVSAGFDSRHNDPLGGFLLTDQDFGDLTDVMLTLADELAEGRLISLLEGGYNLEGLARAATAHCERLALHPVPRG
jgi:acetoin utilization deacetylase AcuC-like enzyme